MRIHDSRSFSHVVYLDSDCDNMFGWGNYLFWPQVRLRYTWHQTLIRGSGLTRTRLLRCVLQLRNSNGTLYGWSLQDRTLIFASVGLGPGTIWGKAVGANQITST
jgi:hypothetical protein